MSFCKLAILSIIFIQKYTAAGDYQLLQQPVRQAMEGPRRSASLSRNNFLLQYTPLPEVLCNLIATYYNIPWELRGRYRIHTLPIASIHYTRLNSSSGKYRIASQDTLQEKGGVHAQLFDPQQECEVKEGMRCTTSLPRAGYTHAIPPYGEYHAFLHKGDAIICKKDIHFARALYWNLGTRLRKYTEEEGEESNLPFRALCFSPCGQLLFLGAIDGTVSLINVATKQTIDTFRHEAVPITAIEYSTQAEGLAVGFTNGAIVYWQGNACRQAELLGPMELQPRQKGGVIEIIEASRQQCCNGPTIINLCYGDVERCHDSCLRCSSGSDFADPIKGCFGCCYSCPLGSLCTLKKACVDCLPA